MTIPIPAEAIEAAADTMEALDGADLTTISEAALKAALPHLLAEHRVRLINAARTMDAMKTAETGDQFARTRLAGKAEGVRLALSYLDELTR